MLWKGCKTLILLFMWDLFLVLDRAWRKPSEALAGLQISSSSSYWSGMVARRSPTPCFILEFLAVPEECGAQAWREDMLAEG